MSITTRLWNRDELDAIKNRTADSHLLTIFMNVSTFSEDEIKAYPYEIRKAYWVTFGRWYKGEYCYPVEIYATDDESALWFISKEYHTDAVKTVSQIMYDSDGHRFTRRIKIEWKGE